MKNKIKLVFFVPIFAFLTSHCVSLKEAETEYSEARTGADSQDISTVYVDAKSGNNDYRSDNQPTMDEIEKALNLDQQNLERVLTQLSNYVAPILNESKTREALASITTAFSLDRERIFMNDTGRIDFHSLTPLLDAIERHDNSETYVQLKDVWPENLRGFALSSMVAALRFGACVEHGLKLIENPNDETEFYCERPDYGKISDWHYNETTADGSFHVDDMKIDVYRLNLNSDNTIKYELVRQWSYYWQVAIESSNELPGYYQAQRMKLSDYQSAVALDPDVDPFVWAGTSPSNRAGSINLPSLPAAAKDPNNPEGGGIWKRDLTHRLFAHGHAIKVLKIERRLYNMRPAISGDVNLYEDPVSKSEFVRDGEIVGLETLDAEHPYMQPSTESCVDIMLNIKDGKFPVTIHDHPFSADQTGWCLGRCTKPVIQNSR